VGEAVNAIRGFQYPDGSHMPLSNFFPHPIVYEGVQYATIEHAFQASKSLEDYVRRQVAAQPSPSKAKKMGRALVLRMDWESIKIGVMRDLIRVKFWDAVLGPWLVSTGDAYLEETNTWGDRFWGVDGSGENWLGFILMGVRAELRAAL
jgi:ribA/ribD-fused uncharacterized protein